VRGELSYIDGCHAETISFVKHYHKKSFELKDEYIRFIAEFADQPFISGKNIKEYFRYPFKDFSLWWFSLISEKNTLKTDSYQRLVKLKTFLDLAVIHRCKELWIDIEDKGLAECLAMSGIKTQNFRHDHINGDFVPFLKSVIVAILKFASFAYKVLLFRTALGGLKKRPAFLRRAKYILVTYFPLVDKKLFGQHIFMNKFYGSLQRAIEKRHSGEFAWLALMNRMDNLSWRQSATMACQVNQWGHTAFFIEEWLRLRDFFLGLVLYVLVAARFLVRIRKIRSAFCLPTGVVRIWPLFKMDWYQSFCGKILVEGILYYRAFSNLLKKAGDYTTILYISEMHAWEKALNVSVRERQHVKTIGIQHTIVPLLLLNYFPHKKEMIDGDYIATIPKPDYLGCVGEIPARLLLDIGWHTERVFSLGAIRSQHLKDLLDNTVPWEKREDKLVVALSYSPHESEEILRYISEAFGSGVSYKILIKGHPASPVEPMLRKLNSVLDPTIFQVVSTPLEKLLRTAKAIIVNESTAALEAVACHCPVIVPRLIATIDMNPLSGLSDLPIYVSSPQEMRQVADGVIHGNGVVLDHNECRMFIRNYFDFLDSDEEFLDRIEKVLATGA